MGNLLARATRIAGLTGAVIALAALALVVGLGLARADEPADAPESLYSLAGPPHAGLADDSALGLALTSGNTTSSSATATERASYRFAEDAIGIRGRYLESSADNIETAKNWLAGARYERRLAHRTGLLLGQSLEADPFAGYLQRYSTDAGIHRVIWEGRDSQGDVEAGYRYQLENRPAEARDVRQLFRLYGESAYRWNAFVSSLLSCEYLPNLRDSTDWLLNADVTLQAKLKDHLALRTAYSLRYAHLPAGPGIRDLDSTLTTALSATF